MMPMLTAPNEEAAAAKLADMGCTDGLPIVVPTRERIEALIAWSGRDPDVSLGEVAPFGGNATVWAVAANAVMAGCAPEHFPVVLGAVEAVLRPEFDLGEVQVATHNCAPLIIVNGPLAETAGVHSGAGALGPGFRANATIGRALRFVLLNLGGGRPAQVDMALLGHPGKFTYCLAEAEARSPFEGLHVSRGFRPEESTVTVVAAEAPHSVVANPPRSDMDTSFPKRLIATLAATLANVGSNNAHKACGAQIVILNPLHAALLAKAGWTRASLQAELIAEARNSAATIRELGGDWEAQHEHAGSVPAIAGPEDLVIIVAGGEGPYSAVLPSWAGGPHRNPAVTQIVRDFQQCSVG